jgi:hypothetical protein
MTGSVVLATMSLRFVVLPISINGRKIDGIVDTGAQIAVVSEDCFKNLKLPVDDSINLASVYGDRQNKIDSIICIGL